MTIPILASIAAGARFGSMKPGDVGAGIMRLAVLALLALLLACPSSTSPIYDDVGAIVFGRITTTSGLVVPGASAVVELLSDSIRRPPYPPECAGERVLPAVTESLDAAGNYRVQLSGRAAVGRRVCVQVTGDPHGLYSDVGIMRTYGGWVELRRISGTTPRDSQRVDVRYAEMP